MNDRIVVFHHEPSIRTEVSEVIRSASGGSRCVFQASSPVDALRLLREVSADLVFLDLASDWDLAMATASQVEGQGKRAIGLYDPASFDSRGVDWFRHALHSGIDDFLPIPLKADEVEEVLRRCNRPRTSGHSPDAGSTVAFFSSKGGVGKSTLAINVALALSRAIGQERVALCDAATPVGDVSSLMGLEPAMSLASLLHEGDAAEEVGAAMTTHSASGLAVLAAAPTLGEAVRVTPEALSRIHIQLRRQFRVSVVDLPSSIDLLTLAILDLCDLLFVVTETSAHTLAGTAQVLRYLETLGVDDRRVRILLNGHANGAPVDPSVEKILGYPVHHALPSDPHVLAAEMRQVPVLLEKPRCPFSTSVARLADEVAAELKVVEKGAVC